MKAGFDYVGVGTPFFCNDGQGNFLFHKRSKNCRDEHGAWDPGSGELDFGLTPEENVLKEVLEEYGCASKIQQKLPPVSVVREWAGKRTHWIAIPYFVLVNKNDIKNGDPDKIDELGWFRLDSLPDPLHTGFATILKEHKHYFDKFNGKI